MVDVNIQVINSPLVNENKNMAPSLNSKMFFVRSVSDYLAINTKTLVCLTKEQKSNKTHMKVFQQNRYHASLTKKKSSLINLVLWKQFPYTPHFLQNIISVYQIRCFLWSNWIILYEDILPRSDLNPTNGRFSCIECAKLCADQMSCQTFFHKPAKMISYLYNYPLMEYTETFPESGIKVYKMKGMYLI